MDLSGLYCYFLGLCHVWMAENAVAGWLVPSEFMDVNYGKQIKEYLLKKVTLLHVHRFDPYDVQFEDALVSSAVVWFKNSLPPTSHKVEFSYGGTLAQPTHTRRISTKILKNTAKWTQLPAIFESPRATVKNQTKLSDLFSVKRGVATGANDYFILTPEDAENYRIPTQFLTALLPSPRYIKADEIEGDEQGLPKLDQRLFLLTCNLPEEEVQAKHSTLWEYFCLGIERRINRRYLCSHRSPWYVQERRPAPLFLCTYMGRRMNPEARPFRFILNHSQATALNVYLLLYPKPTLQAQLTADPQFSQCIKDALIKYSDGCAAG